MAELNYLKNLLARPASGSLKGLNTTEKSRRSDI